MSFKEYVTNESKLPKINDVIYDVDGLKVGTVRKVNNKLITLSSGDQVSADSFYKEHDIWIVEL